MSKQENSVELLLADGHSGEPLLDEGPGMDTAAHAQNPEAAEEQHLYDSGADPNLLSRQRWGVVAPEGARGDRLLELIRDLVRWRQEGQDGKPVQVYRVPASLGSAMFKGSDLITLWKKRVLEDPAVKVLDRPRYLLFLGDLHEIPFELQKAVAGDRMVGRLAFARDQDYEAYAAKVLRWEKQPSTTPRARALFYTVHDGTQATRIGHEALAGPALSDLRDCRLEEEALSEEELGRLVVGVGGPKDPRIDELLKEVARAEPTVLFTLSHGLGPPRQGWSSLEEKRALQGAMSLGHGERLAAEDLVSRPFLPGGLWFYFACFGAGTPSESTYWPWLKRLAEVGQFRGDPSSVLEALPAPGERPFIAALPQTVLANPEGPLAIVGHVDLAWTYGFQDRSTGGARRDRFTEVLWQWLSGRRAGVGLQWLTGTELGKVSSELMQLHGRQETNRQLGLPEDVDPALMAHLWMTRQDLGGYILLGDPAVRLPVGAAPSDNVHVPLPPPDPVSAPPASMQALEDAVTELAALRGHLAQRLGITSAELQVWERLHLDGERKALKEPWRQ